MGTMTGAASTSIQISYSTEDGGIATEEILGFGASEQFLAEVEDVEEYPVNYEQPASDDPKEYLKEDPKRIKGSIEFELKMVTLIADKNCDGVRILSPEEEKERNNLHSPTSDVEQVAHLDLSKSTMALQMEDSQIIPVEPSADERFTENGAVVQHPIRVECAKQNESMGSCLRTSMEICIDSVSEGLQAIAQEIIIDDRQELFQDESVEGIFASQTPSENSPLDLSLPTPYDGPPILSPNYEASSEDIPTHSAFSGDDPPPALTKQYEVTKNGRGRPRKSLNRKRSPKRPRKSKSRKTEIDPQDLADGKSSSKEHKDAHAQHRNTVPVVIPHSSAEIQERVKNRQRKTTQSYGSSSSVDTISEADAAEKPEKSLPKLKSRKRKLSSESSNSESKRKNGKPQNGLFIVEKILKKGIINGRPYFFVKWLNYPPSKNTWEPEANFSLDLIAAYERKAAEKGQLVKVMEGVNVNQPPAELRSVMRSAPLDKKQKCPGCLSYPLTFTDNRIGRSGFDEGLTYHKILESFVLGEERCALVEFDEKHSLELIPLTIINEKLKAEIKLHN